MFRGRYEHTIDRKGRIAIPARFREALEQEYGGQPLIVTNLERCLVAFPLPEWVRFEERAVEIPTTDPKAQLWLRFFMSAAVECPLDRQGRILIPINLREHAAIDRVAVLASMGRRFEIWSKDRLQQELGRAMAEPDEHMAALAKYGI